MAVFHVCSLVTIGAMLGDVTSGQITDFFGRKRAMRMSTAFCITGWLALFFSKDPYSLDFGRFFTGYGIGVISYVQNGTGSYIYS
ncbi:sugar transporter ERD6-like 16 isoform X1 [Arachis ipaensis]|uniref:sugar transporter ERD6-like 16 isoform X1 n=1 Tax=Arachis ipaensis TaxID=130454 RepID=UPI0007AF4724|nr:sugar transporter ERD6-like 16 isoform X1 [Arachis ipaensis]